MRAIALATALLLATPVAADESSGGTADGWLEVARERTALRHAWAFGESGDGASGDLLVLVSDRPLPSAALSSASARDELAAADDARSLAARIPEGGGEIEVFFHHPRLPRGISLRGLARFVPERVTSERIEGRLVLSDPGTAFEAWFSAPIERTDVAAQRAATPPPARRVMPIDEAIRSGSEEELDLALESGQALDAPGSSGMSALAVAADAGNLAAVKAILAAGAAVDWRADRSAMSALMVAAGKPDAEVVSALLAAGANPKLRTSSGYTALTNAVFFGEVENVRRLIAAGADVARDRDSLLRIAGEKGHAEIAALIAAAP